MLTTTLNRIRAHHPCADGWTTLLDYLGKTKADDEPLSFETILAANGLDDALWCLRAEPQHAREYRLLAVWFARQVQHLMTYPDSLAALDVAERHANGAATDDELAAAWDAASDAASDAARAAKFVAARDAAVAAWDAAVAAWDAAVAARDAAVAAWDAARVAKLVAILSAARNRFVQLINEIA